MSHQYKGNKRYTTPPKGMPTEQEVGDMLDALEKLLPMTRKEIIMRAVQKYHNRQFEMKANYPVASLLSDQGHRCYYCGLLLHMSNATIDHMVPLSRGGLSDRENLCASCSPCNSFKASMTSEEFIEFRKVNKMLGNDYRPFFKETKEVAMSNKTYTSQLSPTPP